ncbi:papain-like cysteine protease family protein [Brevibacillus porteri]|uniref:papain-like cysteine protease family protein n=1 Tax=Brevibacillus porteri TaxID=2126350 RepID=UPI003D1C811A
MTVSLKFKSFIALLMAAVLLLLPNSLAFAAKPPAPQINIKTVYQAKTMWCWAATSVMLLDYYGISITQEKYAEEVRGDTANKTIPAFEFQSELRERGIYGDVLNEPATWEQVTKSIDNRDPVVIYLDRSHKGKVGHMMIIEGYYIDKNGVKFVHVNNAANSGGKYEMEWEAELIKGDDEWVGTYLNINKNKR